MSESNCPTTNPGCPHSINIAGLGIACDYVLLNCRELTHCERGKVGCVENDTKQPDHPVHSVDSNTKSSGGER